MCGQYYFDAGDRLRNVAGQSDDVLLVRDTRTERFLLSRQIGERLRLFVRRLEDACSDPEGNAAACVQDRYRAVVILRLLREGEPCN